MHAEIHFKSIGIIHSPFTRLKGMPIQPAGADKCQGTVEVFPEYQAGLQDLEGFSHIILLYHFHQVKACKLMVTPFLDTAERGLFATRAPSRPNPIGISVLPLVEITNNILTVENIDILDGTPLLDIKPYVPQFDHYPVVKRGWLTKTEGKVSVQKSDDRFLEQ
ncbi:tRNA (N6-threonylcarbamoyladenosine(37)-N6)-methyltransferase TrmO [candidate division CSSED10-310 bacterium]|uniref:tRNA (N6-threonylcarbamoyladenosine(37)-N6)-methyltransferase TrmO n=1 Tax=candidate division CSSED10-310 bacterium TaxID=2855610 RepID=A0ABV6YR81_UNCC1